jgi:hypothetical protein
MIDTSQKLIYMTFKTIIPSKKTIKSIDKMLETLTVEGVNPEVLEGMTEAEKQEFVDIVRQDVIKFRNGEMRVCEGDINDIMDEILLESIACYESGIIRASQTHHA